MTKYCGQCGGEMYPLGRLGNKMHYRCRNCGMEYSYNTKASNAPSAGKYKVFGATNKEGDRVLVTIRRRAKK